MKIGILVGRENTFPPALIERINSLNRGVTAEYIKIGGVKEKQPCPYRVILDRISHEIPFYRSYLKNAILDGAIVVNNPFWWSADDKFFNYSLAARLGVAIPKTVLLPQKNYKEGVVSESLRNLEFPLKWQEIVDYVGLPAWLKPHDGGGWKNVFKVKSLRELIDVYDHTDQLCMTLQEHIAFDRYVRCYCIRQKYVRMMPYDPALPYPTQYIKVKIEDYIDKDLRDRIERDCITICKALGYDINTVEFAIRDGIPYAIDFMNPAPDADNFSVGLENFEWMLTQVSELLIDYALNGVPTRKAHRWDDFLNQQIATTTTA
ncbi:MAG: hypothetical protein RMM17_03205 [Acidobacteriota bacterium]|nr:hypothetical protein [Blastocatellia bacterium]MDW8411677.1 hypothetical protein [Acidobacteriota bacterium]